MSRDSRGVWLDGRDHLEEPGTLFARRLDELGSRHCGLHRVGHRQIGARDAAEVVFRDLKQALLEALALFASEASDPVGRFPAALDVRRLERVDIAARAEDGLLERLGFDLALGYPLHRLVVDVVRPDDVGVAVRAEVKRAAPNARL